MWIIKNQNVIQYILIDQIILLTRPGPRQSITPTSKTRMFFQVESKSSDENAAKTSKMSVVNADTPCISGEAHNNEYIGVGNLRLIENSIFELS